MTYIEAKKAEVRKRFIEYIRATGGRFMPGLYEEDRDLLDETIDTLLDEIESEVVGGFLSNEVQLSENETTDYSVGRSRGRQEQKAAVAETFQHLRTGVTE